MLVTAETKPSTDVPEFWKAHSELWVKYQELRNLTCTRFQYREFPSHQQQQGLPLMHLAVEDSPYGTRCVRATSTRVTAADALLQAKILLY